jgi:2-polyprenyl-3-methyl-5-hydroxy-6-metoxy-1,4-benzoquinol methylase
VKDYDPNLTGDPEAYDPGRFDKERVQVRDYADTREYLKKLYPHRGKLIELGCGVGFLLKAFADDGWDVTGIEPDRGFCEYIEKQGLKALPTILETSGIPDNSVDVVVFLHVIEHVPDPLATLETIFRVLKPGGHLVLETPRYDSLMFKLLGKRERSLSCDGHIYFFTTDTLRKLTEKAGFKTKQWRYVGRSLNLERLTWNVGVISKSKAVQKLLKKTSDLLRFNKLHFKMNMRDMQRIVVQKPA